MARGSVPPPTVNGTVPTVAPATTRPPVMIIVPELKPVYQLQFKHNIEDFTEWSELAKTWAMASNFISAQALMHRKLFMMVVRDMIWDTSNLR